MAFLDCAGVGCFFLRMGVSFWGSAGFLGFIARKLRIPRFRVPYNWQRYLQFSRYIWAGLIFFAGVHYAFLNARFYFNDNLFYMMLTWTSGVTLAVFLIAGLFVDRVFCNYFCMKGAVEGIMSMVRIFGIKRDDKTCVHCHLCDNACLMNVAVEKSRFIRHPNCINCMKCVSVCPKHCVRFGLADIKLKSKTIKEQKAENGADKLVSFSKK